MKVRLMDPDRDFAPDAEEPAFSDDVRRDLELDYLWEAMGGGDAFLRAVARAALLHPVGEPEVVRYRQEALVDVVRNHDAVEGLYAIAVDALSIERGILMMPVRGHPEMALSRAVRMLTALADRLERLRVTCASLESSFSSRAFRGLFETVRSQLDDAYLARLRAQLKELQFPLGMLMSARVGAGGQVTGQVLRRGKRENRGIFDRTPLKRPLYSFSIPERDEAGFNALGDLRARSVVDVSDAASRSVDHVTGFFRMLRAELGFYLGAHALQVALESIGAAVCLPAVGDGPACRATGLYDPCLALRSGRAPVANDLEVADGRLLIVTGANHGGKSTFLRAIGVAQLMAQAGMFAPALAFATPVSGRVLTHWAREEDEGLRHGKLDEELDRMSRLIDAVEPGDLLLCNESFASTNEAEGSQIAFDVTAALVRAGVRVRFVTHMYDFAHAVREAEPDARFVRAPRNADGTRSYVIEPGPPLPTSFGVDLYDRVFGTSLARA